MVAVARAGTGALKAACKADDWIVAMRAGEFDRAWTINDRDIEKICRSGRPKHEGPRHQQRIWRGEDLRGKRVLVRCYHGLGDTIQFIRFARPLREIAREVIVWCQPELITLIARVDGVDHAVPLHEGKVDVGFDVDIEIMEIPHAIRARQDHVTMGEPYLALSQGPVAPAGPVRGGDLSIGLVWEAGDWDKRRSIPVAELKRLKVPGVRLFSLQRGDAAKAAADIGASDISTPELESLGNRLRAFDLLICPDTMVAHLSAALGCETWIMLHSDCDWRWPSSGSSTLWYPSARLFHRPAAGDWCSVISEVRRAILLRVKERQQSIARPINAGRASALPPPIETA